MLMITSIPVIISWIPVVSNINYIIPDAENEYTVMCGYNATLDIMPYTKGGIITRQEVLVLCYQHMITDTISIIGRKNTFQTCKRHRITDHLKFPKVQKPITHTIRIIKKYNHFSGIKEGFLLFKTIDKSLDSSTTLKNAHLSKILNHGSFVCT